MRVVMTSDDFLDGSVLQCECASRSRKEAKTVIRIRSPVLVDRLSVLGSFPQSLAYHSLLSYSLSP